MKKNIFLLVSSFLVAILIDQLSKNFATHTVINTGISFGLLSGPLLIFLLFAVLIAVGYRFGKTLFQISPIATGFFFGAGVSNLLDRLLLGGVRDFLPVPILGVQNNLADWVIFVCLIFFLWQYNRRLGTRY